MDGAANAALAELPHAADTEGFERGELPGIEDVAPCLDGVVEALEGIARAIRRVERHDDRRLDRGGQEAAEPELCHAVDQSAAVLPVARVARDASAFLEILRDGRVERRDDVRRRGVAPL